MTIDAKSLELDTFQLYAGKHEPNGKGCAMEVASQLAGEEWTDHPVCVSPVIGAFCRSWNDSLPDADRTRLLKPYLFKVLNTNTGPQDDEKRAWLACDWLVRVFTPTWLRKAGLVEDAEALENCAALTSAELCNSALPTIRKAHEGAAAAWAAVGDAAWAAAWAAVGDAAWDAAWAALGNAAWAAVGDAAWAAARAAAWDAAWDAAWAALQETVTQLQESACRLLDDMIAVGRA